MDDNVIQITILILVILIFLIVFLTVQPYRFFARWRRIFRNGSSVFLSSSEKKQVALKIAESARELSELKLGALIVIERSNDLKQYMDIGIQINADISPLLIRSIFDKHSPIHDGAMIVRGNKIICTSSYLPSTKKKIAASLGSRHRAAIGLSEITDALTIIISETTGQISYTFSGELVTVSTSMDLINIIYKYLIVKENETEIKNENLNK